MLFKSVVLSLLLTTQVQAEDICINYGLFGETIMVARQSGISQQVIADHFLVPGNFEMYGREPLFFLINEAYLVPQYQDQARQEVAVEDFQILMEMVCYEAHENITEF